MNMYTLESLKEINNRFCRSHEMTEYDVEKVNEYVKLHKNDKRVVDKILKNNDVYKNLHKARGRKKDMNMS